uniref:Uncharacterized protein n=1 Tax=Tanacetum cinerariifolium TaxID=118510 RepID=A0A6L2LB21_TANCI|nr:hypothetical protein [Tanacetum cinerariifolium]
MRVGFVQVSLESIFTMTVTIVSLGGSEVSRLKFSGEKGWTESRMSMQQDVVTAKVRSSLQKDEETRNVGCIGFFDEGQEKTCLIAVVAMSFTHTIKALEPFFCDSANYCGAVTRLLIAPQKKMQPLFPLMVIIQLYGT